MLSATVLILVNIAIRTLSLLADWLFASSFGVEERKNVSANAFNNLHQFDKTLRVILHYSTGMHVLKGVN